MTSTGMNGYTVVRFPVWHNSAEHGGVFQNDRILKPNTESSHFPATVETLAPSPLWHLQEIGVATPKADQGPCSPTFGNCFKRELT
jgi:hypothetical protein